MFVFYQETRRLLKLTCCICWCSAGTDLCCRLRGRDIRSSTSPLTEILGSSSAAMSKIRSPFTTRPEMMPWKGRSMPPRNGVVLPPTCIVEWLLKTVNWRPAQRKYIFFFFFQIKSLFDGNIEKKNERRIYIFGTSINKRLQHKRIIN